MLLLSITVSSLLLLVVAHRVLIAAVCWRLKRKGSLNNTLHSSAVRKLELVEEEMLAVGQPEE